VNRLRPRLLVLVLAVFVLLLGAASCGIPSDDQPRAIPEGALPEQAREPHGTGTTSTTIRQDSTQNQTIYLVTGSEQQQRLMPVTVGVTVPGDPAQLPQLTLEQLIATRPDDVGLAGQAENKLPSDVRVLDAVVQPDGVLDLNLSSLGVENARLRLAMAQIVFTATDLKTSGIQSVRVSIDGVPAAVPTQSGSADPGTPIMRTDYADLDPQIAQPAE
jgi:spore germination protein GerM